jgi:tetratricopeptide (TPR) repeat protein
VARALKSNQVTPADTLRELLTHCEDRIVNPAAGGGVPELFGWMDEIMVQWPELEAMGADLRAERIRWESLQAQILRRGPRLLRTLPARHSLSAMRQAKSPPQNHWWWWLDERLAQERKRQITRVVAIGSAVVIIGVIATFVLSRLFPVDPAVREVHRLQSAIDQALISGQDYAIVRDLAQQAVAIVPDDPDLRLLLGVAYQVLDETALVEEQWAMARRLLEDEGAFLARRGRTYLMFNRSHEALQDEAAAVALQPDSATAHFFLGMALEATGQTSEAVEAYTRAAELAGRDDPQLVVMARTRLGALLQQPAPQTASTPIP